MPSQFRTRLARLAGTVLGHEPEGQAIPPRTGLDPTSKRHLTALIVGTLFIMVFGILVAIFEDGSGSSGATPTVVTAPSPAGALLTTNAGLAQRV
jgi:hypothetical protein